jgi:uncharacterized protein (TIRG00374 family)
MNKKMLSLLQYIFFLGLGIFLLWLTLRNSNLHNIKNDLLGARYIFLVPATLMLLVSHFIRAIRWKILIEPLGYKPSLLNTYLAVMIGYWANLAVPRLGEVLKCTVLARYEKIPANKLIGTIVAERAFDVVSLLGVLLITVLIQYDIIGNFAAEKFNNFFRSQSGNFSVNKIILTLVILFGFILVMRLIFKKISHLAFVIKINIILRGIWQGLISVRYIKNKGLFFLYTTLIWSLYLLSTYMGFLAMKDMSEYGIKAAFSALSFGSLGMIIPSPGGIGPFQYAIQQVMLLYGVTPEKGLSLGMLIWFAQTGIIILFGTISFLLFPFVNKKKNENK